MKVVRLPARLSLKFAVGLFPFFRIPPTASIPLHPLAALALPLPPSVPSSYPSSLSLPPFPSLPPQLLPPPTPIALSSHAGAVCCRLSPHVKQQSHFNHQPGRQGGGSIARQWPDETAPTIPRPCWRRAARSVAAAVSPANKRCGRLSRNQHSPLQRSLVCLSSRRTAALACPTPLNTVANRRRVASLGELRAADAGDGGDSAVSSAAAQA